MITIGDGSIFIPKNPFSCLESVCPRCKSSLWLSVNEKNATQHYCLRCETMEKKRKKTAIREGVRPWLNK